jgi:hypothetical protein
MNEATQKNADAGVHAVAPRTELRARLYRWTIYILIVIALAVLVWKIVAESGMQQRHETQLTEMQEDHSAQLDARSRDLLRAMGQMIEPAVLEALQTKSFEALRGRLARLCRETPVERVYVTDPAGQVLLATGESVEGVLIERELQTLITTLGKPVIDEVGKGRLRLIAPLFEQSQKRGTVIIILQFAE